MISIDQAYEMGAKGAEPTEAERQLFEAWMRGHCWMVQGEWDGTTYVHEAERHLRQVHPGAMNTRQLWAAWRDRAALAEQPAQRKPLTDDEVTKHFQENVDTGSLLSFADGVRFAEAAHRIAGDK